jgi:ribosomal protein S18 acetylase RimI-like enzyme
LFILPEYHGQGLGKSLLGQALSQARTAARPLRCHVMSYNPAISFYLSQGLSLVKEEGNDVYLESAANMLFVTDKQQQKAAARRMLPAGQRRR